MVQILDQEKKNNGFFNEFDKDSRCLFINYVNEFGGAVQIKRKTKQTKKCSSH